MSLVEKAKQKLIRYMDSTSLIKIGDKILLAVSGGADSIAMALLFSHLRYEYKLSLLAIHVNHQSRGEANLQEQELVKQICQALNIPLVIRKIEILNRSGFENEARTKRIHEMEQILRLYRFDKIALAHHKNDQAETVLMNLMRGAGINGMAGIKPISGDLIHPMLCFVKAELIDLLAENRMAWAEDASNNDNSFRRNYIRNILIPQMQENINPAVIDKINIQAMISQEAEQLLRQQSQKYYRKYVTEANQQRLCIDLGSLMALKPIEQYYLLKKMISQLAKTEMDFYWHSFEEISALYDSQGSKYTVLQHGITVRKQYQELIISTEQEEDSLPEPLIIEDDRNRAVYLNYRFTFKYLKVISKELLHDANTVILDADKLVFPLQLRVRQAGDRFIPKGMSELKKLKDFFIDEKVPKFERDRLAILCDSEKILWITGLRIDQRVCPNEASTRYLQISMETINDKPKRAASRKKQGDNNEFDEL